MVRRLLLSFFATLSFLSLLSLSRAGFRITSVVKMSSSSCIPQKILLGTGSASRKMILEEMNIQFSVHKADINERAIGDRTSDKNVEELVLLLANAKADAILPTLPEDTKGLILLTADQVVTCNGQILEKPLNEAEFRAFIADYALYPCRTVGSTVLTKTDTGKRVEGTDSATIHLKPIPEDIIQKLLEEGEVFYCAGGLMIEHPLIQPYIDRIEGTLDSIMGLSKNLVLKLLEQCRIV